MPKDPFRIGRLDEWLQQHFHLLEPPAARLAGEIQRLVGPWDEDWEPRLVDALGEVYAAAKAEGCDDETADEAVRVYSVLVHSVCRGLEPYHDELVSAARKYLALRGAEIGSREPVPWQDVRDYMENCRAKGEQCQSRKYYAEQLRCSTSTVQRAIARGSAELQEWAFGSPQAQVGVLRHADHYGPVFAHARADS